MTLKRVSWLTCFSILVISVFSAPLLAAVPGQIVPASGHPEWLERTDGSPVFICGPGDPEGFLYLGTRQSNGTRSGGGQDAMIQRLIAQGGNSIYMQMVRSSGGDGVANHNPFIDSNPSLGLDEDILNQWDGWFTAMDNAGIVIFLFFYDDSACIWGCSSSTSTVPEAEQNFINAIVARFKHHRNLIWVHAEEYVERFSTGRASAFAAAVRAADNNAHVIAVHQTPDLTFDLPNDPNVDQFAMQYGDASTSAASLNSAMVTAWNNAAGRYNLNMSEIPFGGLGSGASARRKIWAMAMGGAYVMANGWTLSGPSDPPDSNLNECRWLQGLFESVPLQQMAPANARKAGDTDYVLASDGGARGAGYLLYTDSYQLGMGLTGLPIGSYRVRWLNTANGTMVDGVVNQLTSGLVTLLRPAELGSATELAVSLSGCVDTDGDGACGFADNCPTVSNPNQANADGDAAGDACDSCPHDAANDDDGDGLCGDADSCPQDAANDADADGVCGDVDNCPAAANGSQSDGDGDGSGDVCDPCPHDAANDADGDGICGDVDNCPQVSNPNQADGDGDGRGDACSHPVLISEVYYDQRGSEPEFIELLARSSADITGWRLSDQEDVTFTFSNSDSRFRCATPFVLAAGDRVVVFQGSGTPVCTGPSRRLYLNLSGFFPAAGDDVLLRSADLACQDYVAFENGSQVTPPPADCSWTGPNPSNLDANGTSISRFDAPVANTSSGADWEASGRTTTIGPTTPGTVNEISTDSDGDGRPDGEDNCPTVPNSGQANGDGDSRGDACDPCPADPANDADGDGVCGNVDNCPTVSNPNQADSDGDHIGDACDGCSNDADGDGVCGDVDNCPAVANPSQANADGDARGDACDPCPNDPANDVDGDGVCGNVDNCPTAANANQANTDGDALGNVCDPCPNDAANDADHDGVCGNLDNCPAIANASQANADGDSRGDACDPCPNDAANDADGDGVCGNLDNCPTMANAGQTNSDGDAFGNACDECPNDPANDVDADDVCGSVDNCPNTSNANQANADGDATGDACDACPNNPSPDTDGDGFCGSADNCPSVANPDQANSDGDPLGNACDPCPNDSLNDIDDDGLCGNVDNCPFSANPNQSNVDGDLRGDACDRCPGDSQNDIDNDDVCGDVDNCPTHANAGQVNVDGDAYGDACDPCPLDPANDADADGVCGNVDNCPLVPNPQQADADGDGIGDACEAGSAAVIISEVLYDQEDDHEEFIELLAVDGPVDMTGWSLTDQDDMTLFFTTADAQLRCPTPFVLNAGDRVVVYTGSGTPVCTGSVRRIYLGRTPFLPRSGDDLLLRSAALACKSYVAFENSSSVNPAPADCGWVGPNARNGQQRGRSVSRFDAAPIVPRNSGADWEASGATTTIGPSTPGASNTLGADLDADDDGVLDGVDNCLSQPNADQANADGDAAGDACDVCPHDAVNDADGDGVCADADNCPAIANPGQADADDDGAGDVCDACPNDPTNDADGDGECGSPGGCQSDGDGDGVCSNVDNCPAVANPNQANADGDAFGDACDPCPADPANDQDRDGVCGNVDNCPTVANANQANVDGDTFGNVCDPCPFDAQNDIDGDGICGNLDNCRVIANPNQANADGDASGDVCDICPHDPFNDVDGDWVCGNVDNCPAIANRNQANADGDPFGDACDPCPNDTVNDPDADGVCGAVDNCPLVANAGQADTDHDGIGDACETTSGAPGVVLLSEVQYDQAGGQQEFIELLAAGGSAVDITGWRLRDNDSGGLFVTFSSTDAAFPCPVPFVLNPGDRLVVWQGQGTSVCSGTSRAIFLNHTAFLPATGDDLVLEDATATCRDYVAIENGPQVGPTPPGCVWSGPNPSNGQVPGRSISRRDAGVTLDANTGTDWVASGTAGTLGPMTPGQPNQSAATPASVGGNFDPFDH